MKSKKMMKRIGIMAIMLVLMVMGSIQSGMCADPKTVAVLPFTMNSPQDLTFLQNGLFSMLSSRLSDPGKVDVLDRETVDAMMASAADVLKGGLTEAEARILGANLGVDYILFGSLTHFGDSVSLDASMVDIAGEKPTLAFFEQSNSMGDVIPLVNSFAGDINLKTFNRSIENELYARPQQQEAPAPGGLQYADGRSGGLVNLQQSAGKGFLTHLKFTGVIGAMAVGDLKNDGIVRVVAATDDTLMIHKLDGLKLTVEKTLEFSTTNRIASLDIADINKNGYPEIFVTSLNIHQDGLQSFVVEWDGSAYRTLLDGEGYYYRVVKMPDGSEVLMAQDTAESPFDGRIYTMRPQGNEYDEEKRLRVPRGTSVLSFAKGPVMAEDSIEYVSINRHNRLVVANDGGSVEWESNEKYGLTAHVWLMPKAENDGSFRERIYLNPRIEFFDVDDDNKQELLVIKNREYGGGSLGRYKRFKEGWLQILSWNGIALAPVFQTNALQGWISDFAISDFDGDGKKELIVSVVTRSKTMILSKDKSSNIISYELE